ncbi:inner centromere protein A isoform X1 [Tachysurus vachellii]|uniref:inner centromere protein A isoform X1 n=1 Tax=Tachysurus vachellii TaxID=175792 RepID=UPI00296AA818|nr:inner centromere protein A isoform X1 [Tachysurus vachellii]
MSSLPEATRSLVQVFNGKLQEFTNEIESIHMVWLEEIQQEAKRMFSSDFSTEPELMPKTPSQKKTNRRKRVSTELGESRSKRRFSKGKRSNLRRSSVQLTLNSISELVDAHVPSNSTDGVAEEPVRRTRRNKATAVTAADSEPVKRSTRNKAAAKAKEQAENVDEKPAAPQSPENVSEEQEHKVEGSSSSSSPVQILVSEVMVKVPSAERLSAEKLLQCSPSPGRCAQKIIIAAAGGQASTRSSGRHSLVVRRSLAGLRHSMTQEAVRRASRRSFLKKKARLGNSTCSSTVSGDVDPEDHDDDDDVDDKMEEAVTEEEPAAESNAETEPTQPEAINQESEPVKPVEENVAILVEEEMTASPSVQETFRITRSMARPSVSDDGGKNAQDDVRASRTASKRAAAEAAAEAICTPKKKHSPPKKCMTGITPGMRSFLHTVQKNQLLMMTPNSLGRTSVMKSFIKHSGKLDVKLSTGSVERERQKWDALNKKIEQENERKKKLEEERRRKQEEIKKKRDERLKRVVEARVKGEKEKEQEKKKKIEEKMAQIEKKNDMLRVERLAEEKAKKKVATKRQEELELRRKQEEAARKKKLQQAEEEERRHQELLAKRKAEEEREKARKQAEAARALELKKEQEKERERERERQREEKERERERERQVAAERERLERERAEREKAIALQKELERAAKEKERRELEEKSRKEEELKKAEEERLAQQKRAAAAAPPTTTTAVNVPISKALNTTITHSPALNVTVDIEQSVMKTPVGKGDAHNKTIGDKGSGLNVTVDVEQSPQSYQITPKGKKVAVLVNPDDYGMDQNSDDSTDDESAPRKPIPSWAEGMQLQQAIMKQYYDPLDLHSYFGDVEQPKLEKIFQRSKPRFFKRTSSAVWHSPPRMGAMPY